MPAEAKKDKLQAFYKDLCISLAFSIRAFSLYAPDHPEAQKRVGHLFRRLSKYLDQRPTLTLIFFEGNIAVENRPMPEISGSLAKFIQRLGVIRLQRLVFRAGLSSDELIRFLQLLVPLLKKPSGADLVLAKNQERLPHIIAGKLPFETGTDTSNEVSPDALQVAHKSVFSISGQMKDLFTGLEGPLSKHKVSMAEKIVEKIRAMNVKRKIPLKILIYRRSNDPDTYIHALDVCALSMALAKLLKLEESIIQEIGFGALLHDIGLHLYPSVPLSKSAATNLDEKRRQWEHPIRGAEILLATPGVPDLAPMVAYEHHIHYDGEGYPKQKRPRDLNLASMITSITNSYDNLRRNRPEQDALSLTDTLNWMDRRIGTHFHPLLFKQFRAMVKELAEEEL